MAAVVNVLSVVATIFVVLMGWAIGWTVSAWWSDDGRSAYIGGMAVVLTGLPSAVLLLILLAAQTL